MRDHDLEAEFIDDEITTANNGTGRILSGSYSLFAFAGIGLFFLPWVNLSCNGEALKGNAGVPGTKTGFDPNEPIATQTGYEIVSGEISRNPEFEDRMAKLGRGMGRGVPTRTGQEGNDRRPPAYSMLWLFPVGLCLVAGVGMLHLLEHVPRRPVLPFLGGAIALLPLLISLAAGFPLENTYAADELKRFVVVERTAFFYAALGATATSFLLAIVQYARVARQQS